MHIPIVNTLASTRHRIELPVPGTLSFFPAPPAPNLCPGQGMGTPASSPPVREVRSREQAGGRPDRRLPSPHTGDLPFLTSWPLGPEPLCWFLSAEPAAPRQALPAPIPDKVGRMSQPAWPPSLLMLDFWVEGGKGVIAQNHSGKGAGIWPFSGAPTLPAGAFYCFFSTRAHSDQGRWLIKRSLCY